jgi:hypothetical protein
LKGLAFDPGHLCLRFLLNSILSFLTMVSVFPVFDTNGIDDQELGFGVTEVEGRPCEFSQTTALAHLQRHGGLQLSAGNL